MTQPQPDIPMAPHATEFQITPAEMMTGAPMDTAHLYRSDVITVSWRGGDTWAVQRGAGGRPQLVWNGTEWEYEPLPSSRDKAFLKRCRFSLADALEIGSRLAVES